MQLSLFDEVQCYKFGFLDEMESRDSVKEPIKFIPIDQLPDAVCKLGFIFTFKEYLTDSEVNLMYSFSDYIYTRRRFSNKQLAVTEAIYTRLKIQV